MGFLPGNCWRHYVRRAQRPQVDLGWMQKKRLASFQGRRRSSLAASKRRRAREVDDKRDIFMSWGTAFPRIMCPWRDSVFYPFTCANFVARFRKWALNDELRSGGAYRRTDIRGSRGKVFV